MCRCVRARVYLLKALIIVEAVTGEKKEIVLIIIYTCAHNYGQDMNNYIFALNTEAST